MPTPAPPRGDDGLVVGVVGAGQLGLMLDEARRSRADLAGITLRFLADSAADPAGRGGAEIVEGSALDPATMRRFAAGCDVVTFEHELVDTSWAVPGASTVRPALGVLDVVADKERMRSAVAAAGVPGPDWRLVGDPADVGPAVGAWPEVVVKVGRGGYDGRGVCFPVSAEEARAVATELVRAGHRLVVEPRVDLAAEGAVIACRGTDGSVVVYDPVRTRQVDGQCREVVLPSGFEPGVDAQAREIARGLAEHLGVVGLLAVELFVSARGELLVNELAARPHNTGHHTIEACATSQFTNHLLAVAGRSLGPTTATGSAAVTVNLIGADAPPVAAALARLPSGGAGPVHVHWYGKAWRRERKLGHVTVTSGGASGEASIGDLRTAAWDVAERLGCSTVGRPR